MTIKEVKTSELIPYKNNPRVNDAAVDAVANSIKAFGFKVPIVIDKHNIIVAGHTRWKASQKLGLSTVPCIIADDLTEEQINAFRLADNKTAELAEWDFEKLETELGQLADDFDMTEFGFDEDLLDPDHVDPVDDEVPDVDDESEPITKRGQIFKLGDHYLMCGDSLSKADVDRLMSAGGEMIRADLCFTSPPYNAGSLDIKGQSGTGKKYNTFDDNQSESDYFDFISTNVGLMLDHADEVFYNIGLVENNKRCIVKLMNQYIAQFKDIIYWEKSTVAPHIQAGIINNLVEFILCFGDGKRKFKHAQFSQGTYWNVIKGSNASGNEYSDIHKATFPLYLPINIVENFAPKHGTVIDCFGGTGTTLIACEQTHRKCRMMELDPKYCDVIRRRWAEFTAGEGCDWQALTPAVAE